MNTDWMDIELDKINKFQTAKEIRNYMLKAWNINAQEKREIDNSSELLFWQGFMHGYIYLAKEEAINYP